MSLQDLEPFDEQYPIGKKMKKEVMKDFRQVFQTEPQIKNEHSISDNEEQFLDKVECLINVGKEKQKINDENYLKKKVKELQEKCTSLARMNQNLLAKMDQTKNYEPKQPGQPRWMVPITPRDDTSFVEEISEIQNQFSDIQEILISYRQQLNQYQASVNKEKQKYLIEIQSLKEEILALEEEVYSLQKTAAEQKISKNKLLKKNNELSIELEVLQEEYLQLQENNKREHSFYSTRKSHMNYHGDQCLIQMQKMIDQLANELQYQRNLKEKVTNQAKRLNLQLKKQEKKIKKKNDEIFRLQKELISLKKQIVNQCSIFEDGRDMEFVRTTAFPSSRNSPRRKNTIENYSSSRRLSGFLEAVIRRQSNQNSQQRIGVRYRNVGTEKSRQSSQHGQTSRKLLKNANVCSIHDLKCNGSTKQPSQNKKQRKRKFTIDLGYNSQQKNKIQAIPQIFDQVQQMSLERFLIEEDKAEEFILIVCKKLALLFNETEQKQTERVMFCLQNLKISNYSSNKPSQIIIRVQQTNSNKVVLRSREQFFFSTLYLIQTILEGKQFYDLNPHLHRVLEALKQAPPKKQKFSFLNLAIDETLAKVSSLNINSNSSNNRNGIFYVK